MSRDWDGLQAMLTDDVKLDQSLNPLRGGRADVGLFFTLHAKIDGVSVAPAWLEGREVIAVFEDRADLKPSYILWLEWAMAGPVSSATTAMSAMSPPTQS